MPHIMVSKNGSPYREFVFPAVDILTIGRAANNDIVLPHPDRRISRLHAAIVRCSGPGYKYFIRDLGSVYGTKVHEKMVQQRGLHTGDKIQIADYLLEYSSTDDSKIRPSPLRVVGVKRQPASDRGTTGGPSLALLKRGVATPERAELLEELRRRSEDSAVASEVAAKALQDLLSVLKGDRGFIRVFSDESFASYDDIGITGLKPHEEIEITDAAFMQRLSQGEAVLEEGTLLAPILFEDKLLGFFCIDRINRTMPFSSGDAEFLSAVSRQIGFRFLTQKSQNRPSGVNDCCEWPMNIVGRSRQMEQLFRDISHAATSDMNVLLIGETGTGKDLVAREIHQNSRHREGPFVARDCGQTTESLAETDIFGYAPKSGIAGARPEGAPGWFQLANKGTLFLDEIQSLSPTMQDKFLRALQEKKVRPYGAPAPVPLEVKVVAATSEVDLDSAIQKGNFRKPLYYRFGIKLHIPALRERKDDIPLLAHYFLDKACKDSERSSRSISHRALQKLAEHDWPGNVRELEHLIKVAARKDKEILFSWDLDLGQPVKTLKAEAASGHAHAPSAAGTKVVPKSMREIEKAGIMEALEATHGNITQAAAFLDLSRQTLLNKMDSYGIPRNYGDAGSPPLD